MSGAREYCREGGSGGRLTWRVCAGDHPKPEFNSTLKLEANSPDSYLKIEL